MDTDSDWRQWTGGQTELSRNRISSCWTRHNWRMISESVTHWWSQDLSLELWSNNTNKSSTIHLACVHGPSTSTTSLVSFFGVHDKSTSHTLYSKPAVFLIEFWFIENKPFMLWTYHFVEPLEHSIRKYRQEIFCWILSRLRLHLLKIGKFSADFVKVKVCDPRCVTMTCNLVCIRATNGNSSTGTEMPEAYRLQGVQFHDLQSRFCYEILKSNLCTITTLESANLNLRESTPVPESGIAHLYLECVQHLLGLFVFPNGLWRFSTYFEGYSWI